MSLFKFSARKTFHLLQCKTRHWEASYEHTAHYRFVFVQAGEGRFILNHEIHHYCQNGIIFLQPGELPVFQEDKATEVLLIAFEPHSDADNKKHYTDFAETSKQVENIFKNLRVRQGKPVRNERDADTIHYLVGQIAFELVQQPTSFLRLIKGSIALIVTILARNNFEVRKAEEPNAQQELANRMIRHLKNDLESNKTIRIAALLMEFDISEEAANLCMLNTTGMSLRNFIFKYKTDLFKSRMLKMDVSQPYA